MLEIRVLGGLQAAVDGEPVELPADARAQELLGWLVVNPGTHARSTLAGQLRPDVAEESARKTLRDAVYELRRAIGPAGHDALVATREQIGLDPSATRADLWEFRRHEAAGDRSAALAGRTGELLAGMAADWVLRARDEHAAQWARALAALATEAERDGDLSAAVARARERSEAEPLSEDAHREVVRLLALAGDRPAAIAAASAFAERLRRELGVPASAETRALVEDIRRGRVSSPIAVTPPALPSALARTRVPAGRQPALERLEAAWRAALTGTPQLVVVSGEPGIGKTTLAGEHARRVHAAGAHVLFGRSDERALIPYQPWVEALETLLAQLPADEAEGWLARHDGALARLLPAHGGAFEPAGARERYLAFEVVREALESVSDARPLLLVLDDLQWADPDSAALLQHLGRSLRGARLAIVATARDDELNAAVTATLTDLRRDGSLGNVGLEGLDDRAVAELLGTGETEAIAYRRRTGGNPFFLIELWREQSEPGAAGVLQAGVREVVQRRLDRLGEAAGDVLGVAAAIGLEFDLATLRAAAERDAAEVLDALGVAESAGLVTATAPGRVAFAHALVAGTISAGLTPSVRAGHHLRIADALQATGAGPAEVVAHLRAAGLLTEPDRLATAELAAARAATEALAHSDAAAHYEAALVADPARPDRAEILLGLGHAHDRAGARERARERFLEAAALARTTPDPALLARAALGFGGLAVVIAAPDAQLVALLEEALSAAIPGDEATTARLRARLAIESYYADPAAALALSEQAVAGARAAGDPGVLAAALNARRVALWRPAQIRERLAVAEEMLVAAEAADDRETALQARNWRVVDLWELGRTGDLYREIDAYAALADAVGLPHYRWYAALWRGGLAVMEGRWEAALRFNAEAVELGARADDPNAEMLTRVQQDLWFETQFRYAEVDREWMVAMGEAAHHPRPWVFSVARLDAALGNLDEPRRLIAELGVEGPMDVNWLEAVELAETVVDLDDRDAAAVLFERLEPYADLFVVIARGAGAYGSTELYLGRMAGVLGRIDEARDRLQRAVARNDAAGANAFSAISQYRLGALLAEHGDPSGAEAALADARERAEALGMTELVARIVALA